MVVRKRCQHGQCKSDTKYSERPYMKNVRFYRFPNPKKLRNKCQVWISACGLANDEESLLKFDYKSTPKFICSNHFVEKNGPTEAHPNPIQIDGKVIKCCGRRKVVSSESFSDACSKIEELKSVSENIDASGPSQFSMECENQPSTSILNDLSSEITEPLKTDTKENVIVPCTSIDIQFQTSTSESILDLVTPPSESILHVVTTPSESVLHLVTPPSESILHVVTTPSESVLHVVTPPRESILHLVTPPSEYILHVVTPPSENRNEVKSSAYEMSNISFDTPEDLTNNCESGHTQCSNELFHSLPNLIVLFKNWTVLYRDDMVKFSKENNNCLLVSFYVHQDMSTSLEILGKPVTNHSVIPSLKKKIESKDDLLKSLKIINNLKVCAGYPCSFSEVNSTDIGTYCNLTQAMHLKTCQLLIDQDGRIKRCYNCQKYTTAAHKNNYSKKTLKRRYLKFLTRKELIVTVKKSKIKEKYHLKQAKLLRKKCRMLINDRVRMEPG